MSADTALRLERYFGSEAKGWLNLQAAYELRAPAANSGLGVEGTASFVTCPVPLAQSA